ncbi:hypothetical protein VTO73DRAFT_9245 [Trametes versicolor]
MHISASARASQHSLAALLICGGQKRLPKAQGAATDAIAGPGYETSAHSSAPLDHGASAPQRGGRKSGGWHHGVLKASLSSRGGGRTWLGTCGPHGKPATRRARVAPPCTTSRSGRPGSWREFCRSSRREEVPVLRRSAQLSAPASEREQKQNAHLCRRSSIARTRTPSRRLGVAPDSAILAEIARLHAPVFAAYAATQRRGYDVGLLRCTKAGRA